jgi:agmatine deiminase
MTAACHPRFREKATGDEVVWYPESVPADLERFSQPAEWAEHEAVWVAWPSAPDLWKEHLAPAQKAFASMCVAIADWDPATREPRGERIELLVPDEARRREAIAQLRPLTPRVHAIAFGDIWLRDTAPIFMRSGKGSVQAACFCFNGWGGKYVLPEDDRVAERVVRAADVPRVTHDLVLEGGSVEVDGEGTVLTTRQCLLHPNRNPSTDAARVEAGLREALGVDKVLWLNEGLLNDHTDGHVDTIARFVAPGVVVCMEPAKGDDPNEKVLRAVAGEL